jgi:hypothetical protein
MKKIPFKEVNGYFRDEFYPTKESKEIDYFDPEDE